MMDLTDVWKPALVVLLLAANAFFVAAEFALVSARRQRMRELARDGDWLARGAEAAQRDLDRSISGTQLGITLSSLGLGWLGEPAVARNLEAWFQALPGALGPVATHATAVTIAFALLALLHIVLGELVPKALALAHPVRVSRLVARPLRGFQTLLRPALWVVDGSARLLLGPLGLREVGTRERVHSPEEIQFLLRRSLQGDAVEEDERAMIHGVFELTRTVAREVMTPRTDIVAVPADASLAEVLKTAAESGFSRFPVYDGSIDRIDGVILVKDVIARMVGDDRPEAAAGELAREALFTPDTKPVDDLLAELRRAKVHMAIVVDEFGGTDGIVTLEDLLEEIVGDIYDEHDVERAELVVGTDGSVLVDGGYSFDDLVREFGLEESEDGRPQQEEETYDTVAGFVIGRLGRIPDEGERVPIGRGELEVAGLQDRRVTRLILHTPPASGASEEEGVASG